MRSSIGLIGLAVLSTCAAAEPARPFIVYFGTHGEHGVVEVLTDKGPIFELIVKCPIGGEGVIAYSKIEKKFCSPKFVCSPSLAQTVGRTCGPRAAAR